MEKLRKIWEYHDLRSKILVVLALLVLTRIIAHVPLPGVDLARLQAFFQQNQIFGLLNLFSGGTMSNFSIILMGVGPYITSSIVFQLLTMIFPKLEEMQKEGESGKAKLSQYTRIATVPFALIQAYSMLALLKSQGILPAWTAFDLVVMLASVTAGTILLMWIGEIISEKGIGNGISLIITIGILSGIPGQVSNTALLLQSGETDKIIGAIGFILVSILVVAAIVFIQEGQRNVPVSYARKQRFGSGLVSNFLPIRVNLGGVIPIIFAMSLLVVPGVIAKYLEGAKTNWIQMGAEKIQVLFNNQTFYGVAYFLLVVFFTYFYTSIVFKPEQVAENLQKQGGYIPGIRPGTETKSYLKDVVFKVTFFGALFLGVIAILPFIVQAATGITTLVLGGTSVLIMVSVVIETMRQIDSQIVMHTYERY